MDLGKTIKHIRLSKKLTQHEFAVKCGITQTYLSQIERNQKEPTLSILKAFSDKLELPLPIIFFLSLTDEDIQSKKREAFAIIGPTLNTIIYELFSI